MSEQPPPNAWTTLYNFFTQTVPKAATSPNPIIAPSTAPRTIVTATTPPPPPPTSNVDTTAAPSGFDLLDNLLDQVQKDPLGLGPRIRDAITGLTVVFSILSLVPTEANFGGPTAARMIDRLLGPVSEAAYERPLLDRLTSLFPTEHVQARMLVSMVENGGIEESDLVNELVLGGVRKDSIGLILKYARIKRFAKVTADDVTTLKQYQRDLQAATIGTLQDQLKSQVTDLRGQRTTLKAEIKKVPEDQRADLMAELKRVDKEIANVQQLIREIPALVIGEGVDQAVARIQKAAAEFAVPQEVLEIRAPLLKPGTVVTDATGKRGIVLAAGTA